MEERKMRNLIGILVLLLALACNKSGSDHSGPSPPPPDPYGRVMIRGAQVWEQLAGFVGHGYDAVENRSWVHFEQMTPAWCDIWLYWPGDTNPGAIDKWDGAQLWVWTDAEARWFTVSTNWPNTDVSLLITHWGNEPGDRTIGSFSGTVESVTLPIRKYDLWDGEFVAVR